MLTLNFALLFVFQLAPVEFFFGDRENLLHRLLEFVRRFLLGRGRHVYSVNPLLIKIKLAPFFLLRWRLPSHFRVRYELFNLFRGSTDQTELHSYPKVVQKISFPDRYVTLAAFIRVNTRTCTLKTKSLLSNEIKQMPLRDHVRLPDEYQTEYRSEDFWVEKEFRSLASNHAR